jgi:Ca-activated chloride channel family protein
MIAGVTLGWSLSINPTVDLDRPKILKGKQESVYILVTFEVAKVKTDDRRSPLNLSLVLDRSGSMSEKAKLEYAKKAAKLVVDRLDKDDTLSIVEYDNEITLLWPASPVLSKSMIRDRIDTLTPRGSTNLSGGMLKGAQEVAKNYDSEKINRVILLSDGLANMGITKQPQINKLVQEYKQKGIAVSTMGLGLSYNEDMMQSIAEYGGGKYYYIESPMQMNAIFEEEINTLFATVAKDVTLIYKANPEVKGIDVFGFQADIDQSRADIKMDNFYSKEKRTLLIKLDIKADREGRVPLGSLQMRYLDTTEDRVSNLSLDIEIDVSNSKEEVERALPNILVRSEAVMLEADKEHKKYVKLYEKGKIKEARAGIKKLAQKVKKANSTINSVDLEKKVEALVMEEEEIDAAQKSHLYKSNYLKKSKNRFYGSMKGERNKVVQQIGDKGYDVKQLQKQLQKNKLYSGPIDGIYSKEVAKSVKTFQEQNSLKSDGVAGPRTLKKLELY